jgi:hypothetical protein
MRYGSFSVEASNISPARAATNSLIIAPASLIRPSTRCTVAPAARHSRRVMAGAATGRTTVARSPARAAYVAQAAAALPLLGIAMCRTPSSAARETPTAAPRALKLPVGSAPSSLTSSRGTPIAEP